MLDQHIIEQHLQNMEQALANLGRYRDLSLEDFERDLSLIWIAEKGLDIGAHILASEINNNWDDYGEIIRKLGQHGIIPKDFSERIQGMADLRSILVHEYIRVDVAKIHGYVQNRLADFVEFMSQVQRYLERRAQG